MTVVYSKDPKENPRRYQVQWELSKNNWRDDTARGFSFVWQAKLYVKLFGSHKYKTRIVDTHKEEGEKPRGGPITFRED